MTFVLPRPEALIGHHTYSAEVRESVLEQARSGARTFLEGRAEQLRGGRREGGAGPPPGSGNPRREIIHLSEEIGATLIVMGSQGLGAVSRALMGSVSDSVVKHAHCPMLVMRH